MIITRTPFRMSFFGGGADMPEFFNEHGARSYRPRSTSTAM